MVYRYVFLTSDFNGNQCQLSKYIYVAGIYLLVKSDYVDRRTRVLSSTTAILLHFNGILAIPVIYGRNGKFWLQQL